MGKSQIIGIFGISRNFLGGIYLKNVSNDFRPLSSSVYIAGGCRQERHGRAPNRFRYDARPAAAGAVEEPLTRRRPVLSLVLYLRFAKLDEMAKKTSKYWGKSVKVEANFNFL